jgi:hypothetical protein
MIDTPTSNASRPYSNDTSQEVREEVLRNDERARKPYSPRKVYEDEPTTFAQFARSQANEVGGRFRDVEKATVVGVEPTPPDLPAPDWANDPTGIEPPLGYRVDEQEACGQPFEIERSFGRRSGTGHFSLPAEHAIPA